MLKESESYPEEPWKITCSKLPKKLAEEIRKIFELVDIVDLYSDNAILYLKVTRQKMQDLKEENAELHQRLEDIRKILSSILVCISDDPNCIMKE